MRYYGDEYSSIFDPVLASTDADNPAMRYAIETNIANSILTFQIPTLSLPQILDNAAIQRLVLENAYFQKLLTLGMITTSLYGPYKPDTHPVKAYAASRFGQDDYVFSSLPCVQCAGIEAAARKEARSAIRAKLLGGASPRYPYEMSLYRDDMDRFVEVVSRIDELIGFSPENYRFNRQNPIGMAKYAQRSASRIQEVSMPDPRANEIPAKWGEVVKEAIGTAPAHGDDRSAYYQIIDARKSDGRLTAYEATQMRGVTDLQYNRSMATRIADLYQIKPPKGSVAAKMLAKPGAKKASASDGLLQAHVLRLYDEVVTQLNPEAWGKNAVIVNWEMLLSIVQAIRKEAEKATDDEWPFRGRIARGLLMGGFNLPVDVTDDMTAITIKEMLLQTSAPDAGGHLKGALARRSESDEGAARLDGAINNSTESGFIG